MLNLIKIGLKKAAILLAKLLLASLYLTLLSLTYIVLLVIMLPMFGVVIPYDSIGTLFNRNSTFGSQTLNHIIRQSLGANYKYHKHYIDIDTKTWSLPKRLVYVISSPLLSVLAALLATGCAIYRCCGQLKFNSLFEPMQEEVLEPNIPQESYVSFVPEGKLVPPQTSPDPLRWTKYGKSFKLADFDPIRNNATELNTAQALDTESEIENTYTGARVTNSI